jgi:hypothetical protein
MKRMISKVRQMIITLSVSILFFQIGQTQICNADICSEAMVSVTTITDPKCGEFQLKNIKGCMTDANPETIISLCGANTLPTLWFKINVDDAAVQLTTFIKTQGTWNPIWAIYSGKCDSLTIVNSGKTPLPTPCSNGGSNPFEHTVGVIQGTNTYYMAVSGEGIIDNPDFDITVYSNAGCSSCIGGDSGCNTTAKWSVTSRNSSRPLDDPKFCPGEIVTVCIDYLYDASQTSNDWLHGLIPNFGDGWDLDAFDPSKVTMTPGGATWHDEKDSLCAPYLTEQMPLLCTYSDPITGRLKLCNLACESCPCSAPLINGSPLPSGWFWNTFDSLWHWISGDKYSFLHGFKS